MYLCIKRLTDIIFSLTGIILFSPLLLITGIAMKLESKGPIIFKQERYGKNAKVFKIWKFRSMVVGAEKGGVYSKKGDSRITRVGKFIRYTSIDELPQFINILKGDMSVIGPRPVLTYHPWPLKEYTEIQKKRFLVRPGITGWAQVNGRNEVMWNDRLKFDAEYVENLSFAFDVKIFVKTVVNVLSMKNITNVGETAKPKSKIHSRMPLKLMFITNNPQVAAIADENGVDWIFVDLEIRGKAERQGHLNTVISDHNIKDVPKIKSVLRNAKLLVRVNPIYEGSEAEIKQVIQSGAEIVMLPYFQTVKQVQEFLKAVNGKASTCLLLETPQAVENLEEIISLQGIDYILIGLNDLHLGYGMKFMFELLANGTVEKLCNKIHEKGIEYGFGGVARQGEGKLPAEKIIAEHYRLGSQMVILSRSFCNTSEINTTDQIREIFRSGVREIRDLEKRLLTKDKAWFENNRKEVVKAVQQIVNNLET